MYSQLHGYALLEPLSDGRDTIVFRGQRRTDGQTVILKLPRDQAESAEVGQRLQREYAALRAVEVPGVVRALALEESADGVVLVLEHVPWATLAEVLNAGALSLAAAAARRAAEDAGDGLPLAALAAAVEATDMTQVTVRLDEITRQLAGERELQVALAAELATAGASLARIAGQDDAARAEAVR